MKESIILYFQKYFPFKEILGEAEVKDSSKTLGTFKGSIYLHYFILFLKALPWLCGVGFLLSFFPQLDTNYSFTLPLVQIPVSFQGILKIISISGLIGFGTNKLAIRMLFRPVVKRPVWGQGLIPAQKDRIIYTLANGMHEHILNPELIHKRLESSGLVKRINNLLVDGTRNLMHDQELRKELKRLIVQSMEDYLNQESVKKEILGLIDRRVQDNMEGVGKFILNTYKRLNPEDYQAIMNRVISDIPKVSLEVLHKVEQEISSIDSYLDQQRGNSEEFLEKALINTLDQIDIPNILRGQMQHFDEVRLERMVRDATNEQLQYIQYLGALLGMLGGLLIWQPELMLMVYGFLLGILYIVDIIIFRIQNKDS